MRPIDCDLGTTSCWGNSQPFGGYNPNIYDPLGQFYLGNGGGGNMLGGGSNPSSVAQAQANYNNWVNSLQQQVQQPTDTNNEPQPNIMDSASQYIKDNPMVAIAVIGLAIALFKK